MQPTYARSVFPCYDEPSFKSYFNLRIVREGNLTDGYHVISNMDMAEPEQEIGDLVVKIFNETPLLPTYLLGFVISDFAMHEIKQGSMTFRGFSRPNQVENLKFGVDTAKISLKLYEAFWKVQYDLEKLDQVALPKFNGGGMENHGIIFYREDSLLYEEGVTRIYDKEYAAANIVHEVCHMFIGNSLTYHWWSSLWMAEGFCKFYEYYMTHFIYPEMRLKELFAVEALQNALYIDSSPTSRPMTHYVEKPLEIRKLFDTISYSKAASVIRMFHYAVSEDVFSESLQIFLSKETSNPEGIVKPEHFREALQLALKNDSLDIANAFMTWEHQGGYPILIIERNYNGNNIKITQKRFTDMIKNGTEYEELWTVPITYSTKNHQNVLPIVQFWLQNRSVEIKIDGLKPSNYVLFNIDQVGYFRVMYDNANWIAIANELMEQNFHYFSPNTRAMLIDDASVFVETEILDLRIFLELIRYLQHEIDYVPWMSATNNLLYIRRMLNDGTSKTYHDFQKFLQILFTKVFNTYGIIEQSESEHHEKLIRNIAVNWACQAHLPDCLNQTALLLNRIMTDKTFKISNDHKSTVMCNGAITADISKYLDLWNLYENAQTDTERVLILKTIGCIENEEVLKKFISKYDDVGESNWLIIIQAVYANGPIGLKVTLDFLDDYHNEFTEFINKLGPTDSLNSIFRGISNRIVTKENFNHFTDLMEKYKVSERNSLVLVVEKNLMWIEKNAPIIQDFLNSAVTFTMSLFLLVLGITVNYFLI